MLFRIELDCFWSIVRYIMLFYLVFIVGGLEFLVENRVGGGFFWKDVDKLENGRGAFSIR